MRLTLPLLGGHIGRRLRPFDIIPIKANCFAFFMLQTRQTGDDFSLSTLSLFNLHRYLFVGVNAYTAVLKCGH